MEKNWILEIYTAFLHTAECNEEAMKIEIDLSWLQKKLDINDALKLEENVYDYAAEFQEFMFVNGFKCAWELFLQCGGIKDHKEKR